MNTVTRRLTPVDGSLVSSSAVAKHSYWLYLSLTMNKGIYFPCAMPGHVYRRFFCRYA